ncbi:hypothetical protein H0E87_030755, partial [Populus deltoides]
CSSSNHLLHLGVPFCTSTLRHASGGISLCASCFGMATVHQCPWPIQYNPLEPTCLSSSFSILHVQVLEENKERRVDVFGWNIVVHNRFFVCLFPACVFDWIPILSSPCSVVTVSC